MFSQWDGYNCPPCYYNSYGHSGYPYPYGYPDDYDCTAYGQTGYPYGSYVITGYYGNYDHGDIYNPPCDTKQPIVIVVENKEKHVEFTYDDLISLSLGVVKKLSNDCSSSCPSWSNCDCCESRNNGRFEFYSECNCSCNGSCQKKCNKKSCKSECGCHSDCCRNSGNCRHIVICEC